MGSALLGERQMLRLNRNVLLVLFTGVIAWTGLANLGKWGQMSQNEKINFFICFSRSLYFCFFV